MWRMREPSGGMVAWSGLALLVCVCMWRWRGEEVEGRVKGVLGNLGGDIGSMGEVGWLFSDGDRGGG